MVTPLCAPFTLARMTQLIAISERVGRRHRPHQRWSASEKASYLDAFRQSGLSAVAFCRESGVPLATFALWKRDAPLTRVVPARPRQRGTLARVTIVPSPPFANATAGMAGEPRPGVRLIVRGAAGHEAALDGVDRDTAVRLVALVVGRRR